MAKKKVQQQNEDDDDPDVMEEEDEEYEEVDVEEEVDDIESVASVTLTDEDGEEEEEEEEVESVDGDIDEDEFPSSLIITEDEVTETDVKVKKYVAEISKLVPEKDRITKPFLSKYEKTRIIATRAHQIARGSMPFINFDRDSDVDPVNLAEEELRQKKTPLIVRRKLPSGAYEDWRVDELEDIYLD